HLGDGRRQRGLAVVDVPDRSHVHVRLAAIKFFLCHKNPAFSSWLLAFSFRSPTKKLSIFKPNPAKLLYQPHNRWFINREFDHVAYEIVRPLHNLTLDFARFTLEVDKAPYTALYHLFRIARYLLHRPTCLWLNAHPNLCCASIRVHACSRVIVA